MEDHEFTPEQQAAIDAGNPDPVEVIANLIAAFRENVETGHQKSDREMAEAIIEAYNEAKSPFVFGRTTRTADPTKDDYSLYICHDGSRRIIQSILVMHNLELFQIPSTDEDGPLFGFRPKDM